MELRLVLLLVIIGFSQTVAGQNDAAKIADKPLFKDPVLDGAQENKWYMFYTNRSANTDLLDGVRWVHGRQRGIASSEDGGATNISCSLSSINLKQFVVCIVIISINYIFDKAGLA